MMLSESALKEKYPDRSWFSFFQTEYISVRGIRTRYAISGSEETVVFLHGFPETLQTWRYYSALLSKSFRLVVFDLKGFGLSEKPGGDYSPWGMADFVSDVMETLDIKKAHLVGTDIGLTIACAFALKHPEKLEKLILMAGTVYKEDIIASEVNLLSIKPLGELILFFMGSTIIRMGLRKGFYERDFISQEMFREYYRPLKDPLARRRALELFRSFDTTVPELAKKIIQINASTLILWAQHERFFSFRSAQRLHNDIRNSQLEVVSHCGHFIQEEKPEESAKIIFSFIGKGNI